MKIYLIRHGQTTGDVEDRYGGDYNDHLTQKGKNQSIKLTKKLIGKDIRMIYHSPRIRAKETANIVAKYLDIPKTPLDDLREMNSYGILTGMIKSEAQKKYPEEFVKLIRSPIYHTDLSGVEQYDNFKQRVITVLQQIVTTNINPAIAIITHGGVIKCLFRDFFKLGEFKFLGDCSIMEIDVIDNKYTFINIENGELENARKSYKISQLDR